MEEVIPGGRSFKTVEVHYGADDSATLITNLTLSDDGPVSTCKSRQYDIGDASARL